jgi:hypothetical protein
VVGAGAVIGLHRIGRAIYLNSRHTHMIHHDNPSGYSFVPPNGWTMMQASGDQVTVCRGPFVDGFTPLIAFSESTDVQAPSLTGSLEEYVAQTRERLVEDNSVTAIQEFDFSTDAGLEGKKLTYQRPHEAGIVRVQAYFFVGSDGKRVTVTCIALAKSGPTLDRLFDKVAKTLELE